MCLPKVVSLGFFFEFRKKCQAWSRKRGKVPGTNKDEGSIGVNGVENATVAESIYKGFCILYHLQRSAEHENL